MFQCVQSAPEVKLDYITGLPRSEGNTTVLTVLDRFSKMVHFIAIPKLPSTKTMAEVTLHDVCCLHGFFQGCGVGPGTPVCV